MPEFLGEKWPEASTWVWLIALTTAALGVARFADDYRSWKALGPGGLPYNIGGFVVNALLTAIAAKKETRTLEVYDQPEKYASGWSEANDDDKTRAKQSFLSSDLPQRPGRQSKALHWTAPQRENTIDEYIDPKVKEAYLKAYQKLGDKHSDAIEWKTSGLERRGQAMFLKDNYDAPVFVSKCGREVGHIHESDLSSHVLLSIADAKDVVKKGWGERHRLTGTRLIPLGYTMLYVPRNMEEIDSFMRIFEGAIEYAKSNGKSK